MATTGHRSKLTFKKIVNDLKKFPRSPALTEWLADAGEMNDVLDTLRAASITGLCLLRGDAL